MSASTATAESTPDEGALYNRYRPRTLAEMVGQDQAVVPIGRALEKGVIHHALLLSGPAGCGKTSTARILAHAMVCAQAPTVTPCGECVPCQEVARGNFVDIIEIDAASNGSVDDARDLREKVGYAPVISKVKVVIVDEAHMVTTQGFNALLKVVEEPPPFVRFIFATTEPDKVIGTIRSRVHNYKFRSVAPAVLAEHVTKVAAAEGGTLADGVLPLLLRAAGGSVRNALSLLGQLLNGSWGGTVTLEEVTALLGASSDAALDAIVTALANRDDASMLRALGAAIDEGADPKKLGEELLDRLRDLMMLAITGEVPPLAALAGQATVEGWKAAASRLGKHGLTVSAEVLQSALNTLPGGAPARIGLEVACSRMQISLTEAVDVPAALARIEAALAGGGTLPAASAAPAAPVVLPAAAPSGGSVQPMTDPYQARVEEAPPVEERPELAPPMAAPSIRIPGGSGSADRPVTSRQTPAPAPAPAPEPVDEWAPPTDDAPAVPEAPASDPWASDPAPAEPSPEPTPAPAAPQASGGAADTDAWARVLQAVLRRPRGRVVHTLLSNNAQAVSVSNGQIVLRFSSPNLAKTAQSGGHLTSCADAATEVLGGTWTVTVENS